jgi:Ca2+-binding EF-hand superfamily protein
MHRSLRPAIFAALVVASAGVLAQTTDAPSRFFEHMLKKLDTNGDGRISLDEFLAAATARFQQIDTQNRGSVTVDQIANSPKALERMQRRAEHVVEHLDKANNGYITQDEFIAAAKQRFAKLDKNGDGKLTPDEMNRSRGERASSPSGKHGQFAERRFELDANHDGVVTLNEYVAAAVTKYKELDSAGNGRVTADEIANSPKAHERAERVAERVAKRLDTNGNGVITKDEFLAAAKQRFAKLDKDSDGYLEANEIGHHHWRSHQ